MWPASRSSRAKSVRCRGPPSATSPPSGSHARTGPRMPKNTASIVPYEWRKRWPAPGIPQSQAPAQRHARRPAPRAAGVHVLYWLRNYQPATDTATLWPRAAVRIRGITWIRTESLPTAASKGTDAGRASNGRANRSARFVSMAESRSGLATRQQCRRRVSRAQNGSGMVSVWGAALLARESEQAAIERLLADQSPAAVFLEGEPGIGKSTVWGAGVATAMQHGYLTLTARGSEAETGLSYSGLTDLLDPVADEVLADLPAPQRDALEVVLLRRLPGEVPIAQRTVGAAVLSTLRQLTVQHRLLLAIDDLQWLDRPTVAALTFALRRLPAGTVRLLTARRLPSGLAAEQAEDVSQLVRDALPAEQTEVVLLDRLEDAAIERLLIDRMELALSDRQLRRLLERVDGNPFWALEVGASVAGRTGDAADELPVPDSLATLVTERVAALTRGAHDALLIVSALHQP